MEQQDKIWYNTRTTPYKYDSGSFTPLDNYTFGH
jgi:hypothetical protein